MGKAKVKVSHFRSLLIPSALIGFAAVCHCPNANADPASKVYMPSVVQGEVELELNGGYQKWRSHDDDRERQLVVDVGYGFTSWWKSEFAVGYTRLPAKSYRLDELEWENIFALTEPGRYWADVGLFAELARDRANGRNVLAVGPMFQHESGAIQSNLNFLLERVLGTVAEPGAGLRYAWQVKWRGNSRFEPGVQGFGSLGRTNDFGHATEHKVGPAFFGTLALGGRNKLKYDGAVLFGLNNNTPDTTVRFTVEYETY
jgi:hypothetical protein